jgi:hypothetical protein
MEANLTGSERSVPRGADVVGSGPTGGEPPILRTDEAADTRLASPTKKMGTTSVEGRPSSLPREVVPRVSTVPSCQR